MALRGIREFSPPGRREEVAERVERAAGFLRQTTAADTQDQAYKLLGLLWAGASPAEITRERTALIALQRADGGWAQMVDVFRCVRHGTGSLLPARGWTAVWRSDLPPTARAAYLLATQQEDGTWFVRTRAFGFQAYFETGFPYGRSQFISTAATAWAATALSYTM